MKLPHENELHPRDTKDGAVYWPRQTFWLVGDRMRGTVVLVTPDGIIEMMPWYAESMAGEMNHHATDVRQPEPTPESEPVTNKGE
jgi:hypothetical protein